VTETLVERARTAGIVVAVGTVICDNCRTNIIKKTPGIFAIPRPIGAHSARDYSAMDLDEMPQAEMDAIDNIQQRAHTSTSITERSVSRDYLDKKEFISALNKLLPLLSVEQIDIKKIDKSQSYCRYMLQQITTKIGEKVFGFSPTETTTDGGESNADEEIVQQLKVHFTTTSNKHAKINILSILPQSWSVRKISNEFNTTRHLASLTKTLVREIGILCEPKKRAATTFISQELKQRVAIFFSDDNISRVCAGKRDYITIDENNQKVAKQRRLLLMNLEEAYALFKQENIGLKIGFSTFAALRPKECVLALHNVGTHAVCVCQYHQNVKLVFEPMKRLFNMESYRDLFTQMMCIESTIQCHLLQCNQCPGIEAMELYLADLMANNEIDEMSYKQWINQTGNYSNSSK
jgi:hypothetical protein